MRKIKIVKITLEGEEKPREFVVKELTCQNILDLSQTSGFFSDSNEQAENEEEGAKAIVTKSYPNESLFMNELKGFGTEGKRIMGLSCDFTLEDLQLLAPSEVKEVWDGFQEVNQTFLDVLTKLGLDQAWKQLLARVTNSFSVIAAIL